MIQEHSLRSDLLPEEINNGDKFIAKVEIERREEDDDDDDKKRVVRLERVAVAAEAEAKQQFTFSAQVKLPNKRVYEVAWGISKLKGYENLEEFVSDVFLDRIEMYPDGRGGLEEEGIDWGFKTREEMGGEEQEEHEEEVHIEK